MTNPEPSPSHPSEEALDLYALGRLPEDAAAPLEEHLLLCEDCRNQVTEFEAIGRAFRDAQALPPLRRRPPGRALHWAGGIAAAAMVVFLAAGIPRTAPVVRVELTAWRGGTSPGAIPAGSQPELFLSAAGLGETAGIRVAVTAADGTLLWQGPGERHKDQISARVGKPLAAGRYWVRLLDGDRLLREFPLQAGGVP
jgi:anti-sigma factor RsiW